MDASLLFRRDHPLSKHGGPGPHKGTGTEQSVHGRGGAGNIASQPNAQSPSQPSTQPAPTQSRFPPPGGEQPTDLKGRPPRPGIDDNPEYQALAEDIYARAYAVETEITPMMMEAASLTNGTPTGLEFALKDRYSIRGKIHRDLVKAQKSNPNATAAEVAAEIRDINRYTITWPTEDESWGENSIATLRHLQDNGWDIHWEPHPQTGQLLPKWKTSWSPESAYHGTNVQLVKDGQYVELQFHTPESWELKQTTHSYKDKLDFLPDNAPEKQTLTQQMRDLVRNWKHHIPSTAHLVGIATMFKRLVRSLFR